MTSSDAQAAIASITAITDEAGSSETGSETGPNPDGSIEKPFSSNRFGVRFNFPFGYSSRYGLFFNGVGIKASLTANWKWKELIFDKVEKTEGAAPPCYTVSKSASVSLCTFSSNRRIASFQGSITIQVSIACLFGAEDGSQTEQRNGSYDAQSEF